jgi:hypothetical protein
VEPVSFDWRELNRSRLRVDEPTKDSFAGAPGTVPGLKFGVGDGVFSRWAVVDVAVMAKN